MWLLLLRVYVPIKGLVSEIRRSINANNNNGFDGIIQSTHLITHNACFTVSADFLTELMWQVIVANLIIRTYLMSTPEYIRSDGGLMKALLCRRKIVRLRKYNTHVSIGQTACVRLYRRVHLCGAPQWTRDECCCC